MDKRSRNKENHRPSNNMCITDMFKVKKCLFDSSKSDFTSPKPASPILGCSPSFPEPQHESPYALFKVRKRASFKRSSGNNNETPHKRSNTVHDSNKKTFCTDVDMLSPDNSNKVKLAVQKSMAEHNLTGDFSKPCLLPLIEGKHPDLKCIAPETVADLLRGHKSLSFRIFDCRYPYEFEGGHIKSARNMYYKGTAEKDFFSTSVAAIQEEQKELLIFYCEFSSERAPSMMRFFRERDRSLNVKSYPFLYYPELYLIEGGYKAFYSAFQELCEPQEYKTMLDKDCSQELSHYRTECKKWNTQSKRSRRGKTLVF
ncbi:hypothetical protein JTE90_004395 [Oedothorax gibbosus]|uniref:protein-tyrosine-phosphatase n=1 Tax=Oedothorax gibbosus TaxID=931172 RepID=A0AAV6UQ00_9ARAC|nr:hypothetical protein JTE90_004395 [Oedothorax gibbosus]